MEEVVLLHLFDFVTCVLLHPDEKRELFIRMTGLDLE